MTVFPHRIPGRPSAARFHAGQICGAILIFALAALLVFMVSRSSRSADRGPVIVRAIGQQPMPKAEEIDELWTRLEELERSQADALAAMASLQTRLEAAATQSQRLRALLRDMQGRIAAASRQVKSMSPTL